MLFDTHTHLNFQGFDADREDVLRACSKQGIYLANVGTDLASSRFAVELAQKSDKGVYATIGLHPNDKRHESFNESDYDGLITEKVVAIGECGLDYFRIDETGDRGAEIKRQKSEFTKQIAFAQKHGLPLVIHCRDAYEDALEILKNEYRGEAVIHSFTDSWETAKKFLDLGFYIALNGILHFDKSGNLAEVAKKLPSDKILTETDAPYLTPPPYRGKRNQPAYVKYVAEKIAEIRGDDYDKVCEYTFNNALKIYGIQS